MKLCLQNSPYISDQSDETDSSGPGEPAIFVYRHRVALGLFHLAQHAVEVVQIPRRGLGLEKRVDIVKHLPDIFNSLYRHGFVFKPAMDNYTGLYQV